MNHYIEASFAELFAHDGLVVMGRGLGVELLYCKFVQYFSRKAPLVSSSSGSSSSVASSSSTGKLMPAHRLVFCINANGLEQAMSDLLLSEGAGPDQLPTTINNECNAADRLDMYNEGGCYFITSRILIVDLLDGKLDPARISGLLVYDAHRISETSIESFIIRVYREKNHKGFIKAFSEDPEPFQSGFAKVERLMKVLFVTKLYLWPRFRGDVTRTFELLSPYTSEVVELSISLTNNMKMIQNAILVAMNTCVTELKKACPQLSGMHETMEGSSASSSGSSSSSSSSFLTLENGLFQSFDLMIRHQLDPDWHKISLRTKQLVNDMTTLRKLLDYLIRYDAFSFYYLLLKLQLASNEQQFPSMWLTSEAANRIFAHAKERVFSIVGLTNTCSWLKSTAAIDGRIGEALNALNLEHVMEPVLECPPKWKLLTQIVKEIQEEYQKDCTKRQQEEKEKEKEKQQQQSELENEFLSLSPHGRVVIVVKDELAMSQLRDVIVHGPQYVMDQRFRWFISQQCAFIRKKHNRSSSGSSYTRKTGGSTKIRSSSSSNPTLSSSGGIASSAATSSSHGTTDESGSSSLMNDRVIQQLLSEEFSLDGNSSMAEPSATSSSSPLGSFFDLGLSEADLRSMSKEMQLMLLQEKVLRMSTPAKSAQDKTNNSEYDLPRKKAAAVSSTTSSTNLNVPMPASKRSKKVETHQTTASADDIAPEMEEDDRPRLTANFVDPDLHISIITHSQIEENFCIWRELMPKYIILYDTDVRVVRNIEVLQALPDMHQITVYFMAYESSTEEHRYVGALAKEKKAFEFLIRTKEHLVISLPFQNSAIDKVIATANTNAIADSRTTKNQHQKPALRKVVVDVREFRSTLPSILYMNDFQLVPRTITVGDYVLSSEICVERKGISDLFQSFSSGRLYNQVESMSKYYKYPCLLIEFSPDKAFCFMAPNEITPDIQSNAIQSKIVLLTQTFTNLKVLWSRSPSNTAEIFKSIVINHDEVDVTKAVTAGALLDASGNAIGAGISEEDMLAEQEQDARATAHEILMSLPGINVHNFREVTNKVENLSQLSKMTEAELSPLIGPANAKKLVTFFRQKVM